MPADANMATIERLYAAFAEGNGSAMTACYAPGAHFRDPAFGDLEGEDIGVMWRMLTGRAKDLKIELGEHEAGDDRGSAHWVARYTFSTGRPVVNDIEARFSFAEAGKIAATSSPRCRRCAPKPAPRRWRSSRPTSAKRPAPASRAVFAGPHLPVLCTGFCVLDGSASCRNANICSHALG